MSGTWLLAAAVGGLWALVFVATQLLVSPPLGTAPTVLGGTTLTVLVILGYPSVLRGPRGLSKAALRTTGSRRGGVEQRRLAHRDPVAVIGQGMPLRRGLTADAAERTAKLLAPLLDADAVAITSREQVLAFTGPGRDHHKPGEPPTTAATEKVLSGSRSLVLHDRAELGCPHEHCPLESATMAPLEVGGHAVGALKVYRLQPDPPTRELVEGIAGILSLHLELSELDHERQLAVDAKLDALRAQINPHFLFNTLNTITSKARTDPEETRRLLLRLSDFFRYSIRQHGQFAEFGQEYFFVRTYVSLEQARFGEQLQVRYDVDPQVLGAQVPVLVLQPLVENAIKHGLAGKVGGGTVTLRARVDPLTRRTRLQVTDDGAGMDADSLEEVLFGAEATGGIGLRNISERIETLFGDRSTMEVRSAPGQGTTVELTFPLR
ncbi:GAF domain-containing protein [Egibacter rhizosphaerae]|uniref:histidine kinase n=1 Tax=Egibacter rhizosphaerae TaxID=1670831 RepID=A0A411YH13_9ACTN|nr:histidine kinase [Egibacter rhizosphaerae]QBI20625.1 GAF domain-containing protein [Egibacter rhizosphaerae]